MSIPVLVIGLVVALILLYVIAKLIKSCLPKIVVAIIILGILVYLAFRIFVK
jgi:hypothetical protein